MVKNVLILVPHRLKPHKTGYLEGIFREHNSCDVFYITNTVEKSKEVIGVIGNLPTKAPKTLHLDPKNNEITLKNYQSTYNLVKIVYNYDTFCNLNPEESTNEYGHHFITLCNYLQTKRIKAPLNQYLNLLITFLVELDFILTPIWRILNKTKQIGRYSAVISQFSVNLTNFKHIIDEIIENKRVTLKTINFLVSKLIDVCLGILIVQILIKHELVALKLIENIRENTVWTFKHLLTYLMGSPIGLKLNHAFNKSLGTFFFYHISLWRVFLDSLQPFIERYFKICVYTGAFGLSHQIAIISDLVSVATFHLYCIYVYAAR